MDAGRGRGLLKRVKVHGYEIDRLNAMFLHLALMPGIGANPEQSAMNSWVQSLYPAIEHFGKTGEIRYIAHSEAATSQQPGCPARRQDLDAQRRESVGEFFDASLVADADQRARDFLHEVPP